MLSSTHFIKYIFLNFLFILSTSKCVIVFELNPFRSSEDNITAIFNIYVYIYSSFVLCYQDSSVSFFVFNYFSSKFLRCFPYIFKKVIEEVADL